MSARRKRLRRMGFRRSGARGVSSGVRYPFSIAGFTPAFVLAGAGATQIDVLGGVFPGAGAVVYVNGVAQTSQPVSQSALRFTMAAPTIAIPGYKNVQVRHATLGNSNTAPFPVNYPVPTAGTISPTFVFLGAGDTPVTIPGTGYYNPGTFGRLDGAAIAFAYATPTSGSITVPAATVNAAGDHTLAVFNATPGGGESVSRTFQVRYRTPAITSKSAAIIPIEAGDFEVTLNDAAGGYYDAALWPAGGSVGLVDNVPVATTFVSATQIKIVIPAAVTAAPGVKVLKVRNPTLGGGGGDSAGSNITVAVPTTTGLSFATRVRGFDPVAVPVLGTNLLSTDTVRFRGEACATTYVSATRLDAVFTAAMLAVEGPGAVTVLSDTGYETNAQTFTVLPWDYGELGATLRGYYPASTAVNDGFGRCSQWTEYVGGVRNPVQPVAAKRPSIVASVPTFNNKPALFFQGSAGECLEMEQWIVSTTTGVITKTELTVWIVMSALVGSQVNANASALGDSGGPYLSYGRLSSTGVAALDESGLSLTLTAPFNWVSGAAANMRFRKTGGSLYARANKGTEVSAVHGANPALFLPGNVLVGKGANTNGFYTGYIGAWLVCDSNVNRTHRAQIDNLLAYEYGTSFGTTAGVPVPTAVTPSTATQFQTPFDIVVTVPGGVAAGDRINVDKFVLATTVDSPTALRATLTAASLFEAGTKGITVSNLNGIGPPVAFTVAPFVPGLGPNLTSALPNACTRCDDPFPIVCLGSNFTATSVAYADAIALPTVLDSPTQITATVTDAVLLAAGNKAITIRDTGGNSAAQLLTVDPWTLNSVPEITGWWETDDVTMNGSTVAQINDKTGLLRHAIQTTAAKQNTLNIGDAFFNGQPSLNFNGTNTEYTVSSVAITSLIGQFAWYFVVVYRTNTITTSGAATTPYANQTIVSLNGSGYFGIVTHTGPSLWGYSNDGTYRVAQNPALANLTTQYATYRKTASTLYLGINGGAEVSAACGASAFSTQLLTLGSGLGGNFWNGRGAMWASFSAAPTAANIARIKNYTRVKYGWA